jgi:hypothetical protein
MLLITFLPTPISLPSIEIRPLAIPNPALASVLPSGDWNRSYRGAGFVARLAKMGQVVPEAGYDAVFVHGLFPDARRRLLIHGVQETGRFHAKAQKEKCAEVGSRRSRRFC